MKKKQYVIVLAHEKGGVCKTTLVLHLARKLQLDKYSVVIIDADPQASTRWWGNKVKIPIIYRSTKDALLSNIKNDINGYDFCIIDVVGRLQDSVTSALSIADLVIVSIQPSKFDIGVAIDTCDTIKTYDRYKNGKLKACVMRTRINPRTNLSREFERTIQGYELQVLDAYSSGRNSYQEASFKGNTVFESRDQTAITEMTNFADAVKAILNLGK